MTAATARTLESGELAPSTDPPKAGRRKRSRFGAQAIEFLLVGGLTPILLALSWLARRHVALYSAKLAVGFTTFYAAYVVNDPHFSVTYFLFYRDARARALGRAFPPLQRARYLVAGFVVPVLLGAWGLAAIALHSWFVMGLLLQLMFFLVGWHYVKQGFGIMTVLAARRGVRFSASERLAVLAHCYAGWAYAWASPFDPGRQAEEKGVVYMTIAHPPGLERLTHVVFLATIAPLVFVLARKAIRERKLPILTPLTAMLCSVWSWSIYSSADPLVVYAIPALHSMQYLYFVWLLRGNEARERECPPHFDVSAKVRVGTLAASAIALGVVLFHLGPTALDDLFVSKRAAFDKPLGPTPFFAAIYAFLNIHHYFMDWVVWRRDNPETRYLVA